MIDDNQIICLEYSVSQKDFTGGYNFLAWLIWVERVKALAAIGLFVAGIVCFVTLEESYDELFQSAVGIFCFLASSIIAFLTRRQYNQQKKGISS